MIRYHVPLFPHSYNGQGQRIRKDQGDFNSTNYEEYVWTNGQVLTQKDQTGAWTDYIYGAPSRVARVEPVKQILHVRGTRDGANAACGVEGAVNGVPPGLLGTILSAGDKLVLDLKQNMPTYGGLTFFTHKPDGTAVFAGDTPDMVTGVPTFFDSFADGVWHHFTADLSPHQGESIWYVVAGIHNSTAPTGTFDLEIANAALVHPDGSVQQIYNGQAANVTNFTGQNQCGAVNVSSGTETTPSPNDLVSTTYYENDALGTVQMELSASGTPVSKGEFSPFGQELDSQITDNTFKFTGKERDAESGLDYFGARYYGSSMGRFMSPDPLLNSGRPDDPQSWNRYTYARNNPLTITDPTGLYNLINNCAGDNSKCNKQFNQEAKQLKDGLAALTKAVSGLKDGDQKTALQGALNAIGTENDGNNVGVQFGALGGNAAGQTNINVSSAGAVTGYTVTFDPSKTHGMFDQAVNPAHEGQHVEDLGDPRYANNATTLSPFSTEYRGYRTSAYAASALGQNLGYGKNSQYPIWNGSWGAVDRNLTNYITSFRDRAGQQDHPETTPHDPWQK